MKAAVVGGGVVGLTTALHLQQELRNLPLTIIAADYENIVSHVAAGIFRIGSSYSGPTEEITREWIQRSYEYYDNIRKSRDAPYAGVTTISGYIFGNTKAAVENERMKNVVPVYRRVTEEEYNLVGGNWKYGSFLQSLLTECDVYLPWAAQKLQEAGATMKKRKIESLRELAGEFDLIVNCTGLGARELCNDQRVIPIRGQLIQVKAPWVKTFFYGGFDTYVIPGFTGLVNLGGSRHFESENTAPCPHELTAIRERCVKLVPALKNAQFVRHKVGLRPYRQPNVRVEAERFHDASTKSTIVHNYGHGGYGVCTAPGTAKWAVQLAIDAHRSSASKL